jgi:hypothetical protein
MADSSGIPYSNIEGQIPSYSAVVPANAGYATPTDLCALQNPLTSGVVMRVTQVRVLMVATAATLADIYLQKRSALSTLGGIAAVTDFIHDSRDPVSSGNLQTFASAPTLAGVVTNVRVKRAFVGATGTGSLLEEVVWQWGDRSIRQPHLVAGQQLALNFNGAGIPAGFSYYATFEWSESNFASGGTPVY